MPAPLSPEAFAAESNVSRETLARLRAHLELLEKWQKTVNLVGAATLADPWRRHFLDSAQLWPLIRDPAGPLVDFGSGAGFPGLVLAILGARQVHLIESDRRKCEFLREAARITGAEVEIHPCRIEALQPFPAATVTARACAPLDRLLALAEPFLSRNGLCLFLKGGMVNKELTKANKRWTMRLEQSPSIADRTGVRLHIEEIVRVGANCPPSQAE